MEAQKQFEAWKLDFESKLRSSLAPNDADKAQPELLRQAAVKEAQLQFDKWKLELSAQTEAWKKQAEERYSAEQIAQRHKTNEEARTRFEQWKVQHQEQFTANQATHQESVSRAALQEAQAQLEQWKIEFETTIRGDAIQRSQSATLGKVTEHLAPYLPSFAYNPRDVRFIGSPVDLLIFDGLSEDNVKQVVFIEVKTGTGKLNQRERQIRDAIKSGQVKWEEMKVDIKA